MSRIEKLKAKFWKRPIPNNISYDEMITLIKYYGCEYKLGGKHPKVIHKSSGTVIPVPRHGNHVGEAYIEQLKNLFEVIMEET